MIDIKKCIKCKEEKPLDLFSRNAKSKDGLQSDCKSCHVKIMAEYRKFNAEQIKKYQAEYRKINAEQVFKSKAEYSKANRSLRNALQAKRNATKLQATPSWLTQAHIKQMQLVHLEAKVLSTRGFKHQVDHIVPLQGENVSGLHVPWNLRAITAKANLNKNNATPSTLPNVRYF